MLLGAEAAANHASLPDGVTVEAGVGSLFRNATRAFCSEAGGGESSDCAEANGAAAMLAQKNDAHAERRILEARSPTNACLNFR